METQDVFLRRRWMILTLPAATVAEIDRMNAAREIDRKAEAWFKRETAAVSAESNGNIDE